MGTFFLFFIFIAFTGLLFKTSKVSYLNNKLYIYLCGICIFLISGLRHETVGNDTISYIEYFKQIKLLEWNSVFEQREPGFALLVKIITLFSDNPNFFIATVAAIFTFSICFLIYKNSKDHFFSFILLVTLGIFYFSMAGLRQIIAMSILIFSVKFIQDRKILPFLTLVFIAYFFHNTAIIFILAYIISYFKIGLKYLIVFVGCMILAFYFQDSIKTILFNSISWDRLSDYENRDSNISLTGFYIQVGIATYCLTYYKKTIEQNTKNIIFYNLMYLGIIFQMFTPIIGEFFRLSIYFNIFNIILIPNVLMSKNQNEWRAIEYLFILSILLTYFIFSSQGDIISEYKFYWQ